MFYTHYRGRSVGRILGFVEECCGLKYAEWACVSEGKIEYNEKLLGTFTWEGETDVPKIQFTDPRHQRTYIIKRHFIDNRYLLGNLTYTIQEMTRYLKFGLGSEYVIKQQLLKWWYPATAEQIEEYYPILEEICLDAEVYV